ILSPVGAMRTRTSPNTRQLSALTVKVPSGKVGRMLENSLPSAKRQTLPVPPPKNIARYKFMVCFFASATTVVLSTEKAGKQGSQWPHRAPSRPSRQKNNACQGKFLKNN